MWGADGPLVKTTMCLYGSGMASGHSHGNASLPLVLTGGTAFGLRHGRQLDFNLTPDFRGYGTHPGMYHSTANPRARLRNLLLTMAQQMGVRAERFPDSTGPVAGLVG